MRRISLKLPDDLLADLTAEAKARDVTKSWLVGQNLRKALQRSPGAGELSCYDLAGVVKGLPEDLADDPKYMDGFGQ